MAISKELQKRLEALETEQFRQEKEVNELTLIAIPNIKPKKVEPQSGFVIRLDFGAGSPISEWSDETHGWRSYNLGTRYATEQQAKDRLTELKQKWPEYPLKIYFSN